MRVEIPGTLVSVITKWVPCLVALSTSVSKVIINRAQITMQLELPSPWMPCTLVHQFGILISVESLVERVESAKRYSLLDNTV